MPIRQKEQPMADETKTEAEAPAAEETAAEVKKSTKTAIPEGWISPVDFAKERGAKLGTEVKPQMVYGYIKNMKDFPFKERGPEDKPRFIVKVPEAHEFLDNKAKAKQEKEAAKAAAAAAEVEKTKAEAEKAKTETAA